ncbi:MAG: hypothetical protein AAFN27_10835 [Pseudomonadota bacterium]
MTVEAVTTQLESLVGNQYKWDPGAVRGSLHYWLTTTGEEAKVPDMVAGGMQCFGLPVRVAYNLGALSYAQASEMYSGFIGTCFAKSPPTSFCPDGVTQAYWTKTSCIPCFSKAGTGSFPRGSAVFFSTKQIAYSAHFAVATGEGTNMVSFGHGAGLLAASLAVGIRDMEDLQDAYGGLFTACHYGTPAW